MVYVNALYVRSKPESEYRTAGDIKVTTYYNQHTNTYLFKITYRDSKGKNHSVNARFDSTDFENMLNISKLIWGKEECLG